MKTIATLTMNPTIDVSYEVERVTDTVKLRATNERYAPGGGGINVARVFVRLGGNARCVYLSGGPTGPALDGILDLHQIVRMRVPIAGPTRLATAVYERATGKEYRFTPAGPTISQDDCNACLEALATVECDMLVASGSLPPGAPADFYGTVSMLMKQRGIETVLDTSGNALKQGLEAGEFLLVKPNLSELGQLAGRDLSDRNEIAEVASMLVKRGKARLVAVTLGQDGALLASAHGVTLLPAPPIEAKSAVGAGDSFTAAMVHGLARGLDPIDAFRLGMAAGAAAVLTPGTDLAYLPDVERIASSLESG